MGKSRHSKRQPQKQAKCSFTALPIGAAGTHTFVLNIPPNFQRDILAGRSPTIQLNVDATRMTQAFTGSSYVQQIVQGEVNEFVQRFRSRAAPAVELAPTTHYVGLSQAILFHGAGIDVVSLRNTTVRAPRRNVLCGLRRVSKTRHDCFLGYLPPRRLKTAATKIRKERMRRRIGKSMIIWCVKYTSDLARAFFVESSPEYIVQVGVVAHVGGWWRDGDIE